MNWTKLLKDLGGDFDVVVDKDRIWERIQKLGEIGTADDGGINRFAFTDEDWKATSLVREWMKEAGLRTWIDPIGNVFGRLDGKVDGPVILTGSHLDTVPNGGKFDGIAGVVAALEVLQIMKENSIENEYPVEMVIFRNEEGSRFPGGLMGSLAVTGKLPSNYAYEIIDKNGSILADTLKKYGIDPEKIQDAKRTDIKSFFELHIEQASILENSDIPVGIVTGIAGAYQMKLNIYGRSGHAGAVPMEGRKDPMTAAAMIIQEVERSAIQTDTTRGTVGYINSKPGGHNIIPAEVEITLDYRDIDMEARRKAIERIKNYIYRICEERDLKSQLIITQDAPAIIINEGIVKLLENTAEELLIPTMSMPSGAAHDAMIMAKICKTGMIFVRSKEGLSHCPEEFSSKEDLALATELLFHSIKKAANRTNK